MHSATVQYTGLLYVEPPITLTSLLDSPYVQLPVLPDGGLVRNEKRTCRIWWSN
jgi:hypothetical protein